MSKLVENLFAASSKIRYVAVYRDGDLLLEQRPDLQDASSSESDRYEELLVNPTVLRLTQQRGNIDCGGLAYVLIRYGHFFQLVLPVAGGHLSVAIEATGNPIDVVEVVRRVLGEEGEESSVSEAPEL